MELIDKNTLIEIFKSMSGIEDEDIYYRMVAEVVDSPIISSEPKWISVEEMLPEEYDTIFAKFYGTEKWRAGMFLHTSDDVIVVIELEDGTKIVRTSHTKDGQWANISNGIIKETVTHWMPLPKTPSRCDV